MSMIAVASTNPVKLQAALAGFAHAFPENTWAARGVAAKSGVPDQPMTSEETLLGARNRVEDAMQSAPGMAYWVGLEGGIEPFEGGLLVFAWAVVRDASGREGKSRSAAFTLPQETASLVLSGMELGDADDQVFGRKNNKQQAGSVGILTHNVITRTLYYEHAVVLALIPFTNPSLTF